MMLGLMLGLTLGLGLTLELLLELLKPLAHLAQLLEPLELLTKPPMEPEHSQTMAQERKQGRQNSGIQSSWPEQQPVLVRRGC